MNTKINEIEINRSIHERNEQLANRLNGAFTENGIFAVNVMGAPGTGKTSALIRIIERLSPALPCFVVEGDIESDIDARKLAALGIQTVQINTGGACHLDAPLIERAVKDVNLQSGVLFIENIGNLVCPAEFMIGEHIKLLITSVTEGSDKPYKYPLAFEKADAVILGKSDLIGYVDFNREEYMTGVRRLNPSACVFEVSAREDTGFDEVADWIRTQAAKYTKK